MKSYSDGILQTEELPASIAFELVTTYGFPFELVEEEARTRGMTVNRMLFENRMEAHRLKSREGAEQKFKGGLAGTGEMETKYHTATHLLHQALRDVLGSEVRQKGSNITAERLRFDFSFPRKMTDEEKQKVEEIVNKKIAEALPMQKIVLPKGEAEKTGALHFFGDKYGDQVNVYYIGNSLETAYSKEFCGGPHVQNTSELGHFKIVKEEAVSAGVRRIKAILE
jgi:alanyl-tRNA synthetase